MTDAGRRARRPGGSGRFMVEEFPEAGWSECRVIDLSLGGAALGLFGVAPRVGSRVRLDFWLSGDATGVLLRGVVRNASAAPENVTRVGVAFTELTGLEHDVLAALLQHDLACGGSLARGTWSW
jgi:hypothetical protein